MLEIALSRRAHSRSVSPVVEKSVRSSEFKESTTKNSQAESALNHISDSLPADKLEIDNTNPKENLFESPF